MLNKFAPVVISDDKKSITLPAGAELQFVTPPGALRLQINDVDQLGEGGRVVMVADNTEDDTLTEDEKISAITVIKNYRKDAPMRDYPMPKGEENDARWTMILIKHTPN